LLFAEMKHLSVDAASPAGVVMRTKTAAAAVGPSLPLGVAAAGLLAAVPPQFHGLLPGLTRTTTHVRQEHAWHGFARTFLCAF